jgi:hypothetical protein
MNLIKHNQPIKMHGEKLFWIGQLRPVGRTFEIEIHRIAPRCDGAGHRRLPYLSRAEKDNGRSGFKPLTQRFFKNSRSHPCNLGGCLLKYKDKGLN